MFTERYDAYELREYYIKYLTDTFHDKVFYDDENQFDIRAVGFDIIIDWPDGRSEPFHSEFKSIDWLSPIFVNPGTIADDGLGFPINNTVETDGSVLGVMVIFQEYIGQ